MSVSLLGYNSLALSLNTHASKNPTLTHGQSSEHTTFSLSHACTHSDTLTPPSEVTNKQTNQTADRETSEVSVAVVSSAALVEVGNKRKI